MNWGGGSEEMGVHTMACEIIHFLITYRASGRVGLSAGLCYALPRGSYDSVISREQTVA